jgi:hypothetical protein
VPYEPWYDEHAEVYDMEPGDMLHWALNGPTDRTGWRTTTF